MSQYFELGDKTLWNPSNGASRLFLRQVAVFEAELGLPSGIGPMENDDCQIDPVALGAFADALLAHHRRTNHAIILALSEGFTAALLVLAQRTGVEVRWAPSDSDPDHELRDVQVRTHPAAPAIVDRKARVERLGTKVRELDHFMAR